MRTVAEKFAHLQLVARHLGETGDAADARLAEALRAVMRGEDFATAYGLAPGYSAVGRERLFEAALGELRAMFPTLRPKTLARKLSLDLEPRRRLRAGNGARYRELLAKITEATAGRSVRHFQRKIREIAGTTRAATCPRP